MRRLDSFRGDGREAAFEVDSPERMERLARRCGELLPAGAAVSLEGGLGAGKTFFVKGAAPGLGVESEVLSPTFILVEEYRGIFPVMHFDLYRLENIEEVEKIGLFDSIDGRNVVLVEWGDRLPPGSVDFDVRINIRITGKTSREVKINGPDNFIQRLMEEEG